MLQAKGIKAVFYDLDGTLRTSNPPPREAFANQAAHLGLAISAEDRLRVARWEHSYFAESDEVRADRLAFPESAAFWTNYGRRQLVMLGASAELAEELAPRLELYMSEHYRPEDILMPDVQQVLQALRTAGYALGVVSNRDQPYHDYLQEIGLAEYFDFSLAAGEVNSWKPDSAVFEHALQRANVRAEETVYVGDNYFADVVGARNAGLKPVLLDVHDLFEQPDCPVICSHPQLLELLEKGDGWADERSELRLS
jgi:HAD superfamily hydrolase (TIGR01549 family)